MNREDPWGLAPRPTVQAGPFLVRQTQVYGCDDTSGSSSDCFTRLQFGNSVVARYDLGSVIELTIP